MLLVLSRAQIVRLGEGQISVTFAREMIMLELHLISFVEFVSILELPGWGNQRIFLLILIVI